jgi:hypothetical protein
VGKLELVSFVCCPFLSSVDVVQDRQEKVRTKKKKKKSSFLQWKKPASV